MKPFLAISIFLCAGWVAGCGVGTERPPPGWDDDPMSASLCENASYGESIEPVLQRYCLQCHSAGTALGGFSVHSWEAVVESGSYSGATVVPGDCVNSLLYRRIAGVTSTPMPPTGYGSLTQQEIDCICAWIDAGCPDD